jgi:hypothetical protein
MISSNCLDFRYTAVGRYGRFSTRNSLYGWDFLLCLNARISMKGAEISPLTAANRNELARRLALGG